MKLSDVCKDGASRFGRNPCVAYVGHANKILTFQSAWQVLLHHETWLQSIISQQQQQKKIMHVVVAYLSGNTVDMLLSMLACMNLDNATVALLNTRWTPTEMAALLQTNHASARTVILYGPGFADSAQEASDQLLHPSWTLAIPAFSETRLTSFASTMSTEYDSKVHRHNNQDQDINEDIHTAIRCESGEEDAVIVFTSGTTSGSKGVRLSHKSLWIQSLAKLQRPCGYTQQTRMLASTVPLFHVGGLSSTLAVLLAGGTLVVPSSPLGFNPISVFQSVTSKTTLQSANTLVVVPAMLHSLLQHVSHHETYDSVKLLLIGGQSASPDTIQHVARVFPNARLVQTFACTEAASSMTFLEVKPEDGMQHSSLSNGPSGDCVGVPPPHVELALVDAESQRTIPIPFQVGVFATRGPHVMNGYWTRNGASENLSRDEWYVTSDLGFYDENGQFYFSGRAKDVIRTGGETVIALEVERILQSHPGIRECSVFALPDERFGETVCAAIVCNNTNTLALSDVRSFCSRCSLAGYKQPRAVYLVNELPRNSSGKVVKYQLVERFREPQPLRSQL